MADDLHRAFAQLRDAVLDDEHLVRALASGRRRGQPQPRWRRVELRYVDLKAGRHLQVTAYDDTQAHVTNRQDAAAAAGRAARRAVRQLARRDDHAHPPAAGHQEGRAAAAHQRARRAGDAAALARPHQAAPAARGPSRAPSARHLRRAGPGEAVPPGEVPPGRGVPARPGSGHRGRDPHRASCATPTPQDPLRVVDLGCGNAYLTFAAHAWLSEQMPVRLVGVDVKEQSRRHNTEVAEELGSRRRAVLRRRRHQGRHARRSGRTSCSPCTPATPPPTTPCFRAVDWEADLVLAAPCCHHDISAQLRQAPAPAGYAAMTRDGILRERLADTLTDALRASILRLVGYRVDVVEFVDSKHTPRNTLLRAVRTGAEPREQRPRGVRHAHLHLVTASRPRRAARPGTPAGDPPTAAGRCAARRDRRTSRGGRDDHGGRAGQPPRVRAPRRPDLRVERAGRPGLADGDRQRLGRQLARLRARSRERRDGRCHRLPHRA